ncbi:hypothetical protein IKG41_00730 [Candidatus Saccharibacteria bacterium]|nr:hypothetical protein [Candidatus Saccharibacteria bacterium]
MQYEDGDVSPLKAFFRKKWVRLVLILDVVAIIAVIVIVIINSTRVSTLVLNITPIDATISVNGDTHYENGAYAITPGTYEIIISHDGLQPKTFSVDIAPRYVSTISTFLSDDNSNYEFYKLKENYLSLQKLIEIASENHNTTTDHDSSAADFIKKYQNKLNIIQNVLPIKYSEYEENSSSQSGEKLSKDITIRIGSTNKCKTSLCIEALMLFTRDKKNVEDLLVKKGIEYKDYEIVYTIY